MTMNPVLAELVAETYGTDIADVCPHCLYAVPSDGATCRRCRRRVRCARCRNVRPCGSRRLCDSCHTIASRDKTLDDWPPDPDPYSPAQEAAYRRGEYFWLRDQNVSIDDAARQVGIPIKTARKYENRRGTACVTKN